MKLITVETPVDCTDIKKMFQKIHDSISMFTKDGAVIESIYFYEDKIIMHADTLKKLHKNYGDKK